MVNRTSASATFLDYGWQDIDAFQKVSNTKILPWKWICSIHASFPKPVYKLTMPHSRQPKTEIFGSGVLISPRHVLTVAHNILGLDPKNLLIKAEQIKVSPGRNDDKFISYPFRTIKHLKFYYRQELNALALATTAKGARFDLALIELRRSPGNRKKLGWWSKKTGSFIKSVTPSFRSLLKTRKVNIAGYPFSKDPDFTNQLTPAGLLYHDFDSVYNLYPNMLTYNAWSDAGMSGGPVWIYDKHLGKRHLIGVHQGRDLLDSGKGQGVLLRPKFIKWLQEKQTILYQ